MKVRKKLIIAGFAILSLLITTVTTTFAWFSLNDAAWVDNFEMEIYNSDKLMLRHPSGDFKQMLTKEDIVAAINDGRVANQITSLEDIKFSEVHSLDGKNFYKLVPSYDEMNRKTVDLKTANLNSYLSFTLTFTVEPGNTADGQIHPSYFLRLSENDNDEGVKKTSITAENQTIKLVNKMNAKGKVYERGESITVNPVNALRLAIKGDSSENSTNSNVDYIYELVDDLDLGSYAIRDAIVESSGVNDARYYSSLNAAFTYYNNINNNILDSIGYDEYNDEDVFEQNVQIFKDLVDKTKYSLGDNLATFKYDEQTKTYNEATITISLWLEGFDADNLIGLDSSAIKCLLSFTLVERSDDNE